MKLQPEEKRQECGLWHLVVARRKLKEQKKVKVGRAG
jgi:hypothetical protein